MLRALGSVVQFEALAKGVRCHPDDRVDLRIEILGAPQGVNRDVVFLGFVRASLEIFLADKAQDFGKIVNATEWLRIEERIQLRTFGLELASRRFHSFHPGRSGQPSP
jgi:hypothetical protein